MSGALNGDRKQKMDASDCFLYAVSYDYSNKKNEIMSAIHWKGLDAFLAIVEAGTIRGAADALNVQPPAVSQSLAKLEAELGAPLFRRTTREIAITAEGEALLRAVRPAFASINDGIASIRGEATTPTGTISLTAPHFAVESYLLPMIAAFSERYPDIDFNIHPSDELDSLVEGKFDGGIRLQENVQQDYVALRLTPEIPECVFAAPAYLGQYGVPKSPMELRGHRGVRYAFSTGRLSDWRFSGAEGPYVVEPRTALTVTDTRSLVDAVANGLGVGYILRAAVEPALSRRDVVALFEGEVPSLPGFFLYFPKSSTMTRRFRAFVDFAKGWPS
ncbi:MAG: LysR substrate-binding domain-containing protein [Pseudomonadota bacterium]